MLPPYAGYAECVSGQCIHRRTVVFQRCQVYIIIMMHTTLPYHVTLFATVVMDVLYNIMFSQQGIPLLCYGYIGKIELWYFVCLCYHNRQLPVWQPVTSLTVLQHDTLDFIRMEERNWHNCCDSRV